MAIDLVGVASSLEGILAAEPHGKRHLWDSNSSGGGHRRSKPQLFQCPPLPAPRCPVIPGQLWDLNRGLRDLEVKSRVAEATARRSQGQKMRQKLSLLSWPGGPAPNSFAATSGQPAGSPQICTENLRSTMGIIVFLQKNWYDQVM